MKQLKEIFQRKTSVWLALELILVTLACWWAFDPVLVSRTVTHLPMGYDADRLVRFQVASTMQQNWQIEELGTVPSEEEVLLQKVREMDEVVEAYPARSVPLGFHSVPTNSYFFNEGDSLLAWQYRFMPDSKMFEVYGIQSITPDMPTSLLTHDCEYQRSIILTRSMAMGLFGTTDVAGRTVFGARDEWVSDEWGYNGRTEWVRRAYHIRAVVEDVRIEPYDRDYAIAFLCEDGPEFNVPIIARLRDDVSGDWFVEARRQEVQRDLVTEHCYVRDVQTARQVQKATIEITGVGRQMRRNLLIAAFFAINLAFGVFGTLLMYTRQRREEAGVRRAFGATKWSVFLGFIREAWLLTTISVILGCIIYFQFAAAHGLFNSFMSRNPAVHFWFDDFGTHFLVVSAIVYLIILCAVLIATAIPALRICRSEITEALKDE